MSAGSVLTLSALVCTVSWGIAFNANRTYQAFERLPGLFGLGGHAARLDPRLLALFLPPVLLTLICALVAILVLALPGDKNDSPELVIIATGAAMVFSQFWALKMTKRWADRDR